MLDRYLFDAELKTNVIKLLLATVFVTIVVGYANIWLGNNSLFFVSLISLALAYPTISYLRKLGQAETSHPLLTKTLWHRHGEKLLVFWALFAGATIGMCFIALLDPPDFLYQEAFVDQVITGQMVGSELSFAQILANNILVAVMTFVISCVVFSGFIFVLMWNASIIAYFLWSLGPVPTALSTGLFLLARGLLEVGGFALVGVAGSLVAYKVDHELYGHSEKHSFFCRDVIMLIGTGLVLIVVGAFVETL